MRTTAWMTGVLVAAVVCSLVAAGSVQGAAISILNASFENPALADGAESYPGVPDWVSSGGVTGVINPKDSTMPGTTDPDTVLDGDNAGFANGTGTLSQTLSATLQTYTSYNLTALLAHASNAYKLNYEFRLLAGGVELASRAGTDPAPGTVLTDSVIFNTGPSHPQAGQALSIEIYNPISQNQLLIDVVSLERSAWPYEPLYHEIFPSNGGSQATLGSADWSMYKGDGDDVTSDSHVFIGAWASGIGNNNPLNSAPAYSERERGYFASTFNDGEDYLLYTDEYPIPSALASSFRWWQQNGGGNDPAPDVYRVAVEIGGQWYASEETFANSVLTWQQRSLDLDGASWRLLDFQPGSELALGNAATLPNGLITAFGLYSDGISITHRVDNFGVLLRIPEPSTMVLLAIGSLVGLLLTSRRKRRIK